LALVGEVEEAVNFLWEMTEKQRSVEFITYRTVLDEICRRGRVEEAMKFLQELQEKDLVDGHTYRKLLYVLEDDYGNSENRIDSGSLIINLLSVLLVFAIVLACYVSSFVMLLRGLSLVYLNHKHL
jgi:pentatricopeptide repeat protein